MENESGLEMLLVFLVSLPIMQKLDGKAVIGLMIEAVDGKLF